MKIVYGICIYSSVVDIAIDENKQLAEEIWK